MDQNAYVAAQCDGGLEPDGETVKCDGFVVREPERACRETVQTIGYLCRNFYFDFCVGF